jgi:hypothetical protein
MPVTRIWPTQAGWQSVFDQLHSMFPNAKLGVRGIGHQH